MSLSFDVSSEDLVSGILLHLGDSIADRTALNDKIGLNELSLVQDHLTNISNERHATANQLGAEPSNFWQNPGGYTESSADANSASVSIHHAGIGRAARDITIEPGPGKKFLTLPLLAEAYNQRAAGLENLFVIKSHEGALFLARHEDGKAQGDGNGLQVLYLLVTSVTQKQDRTLLPPDVAFVQTAIQSCQDYFDALLQSKEVA